MAPSSAAMRSKSAFTWVSSVWSSTTGTPIPPRAVISSAVAKTVPGSGASPSVVVRPVT